MNFRGDEDTTYMVCGVEGGEEAKSSCLPPATPPPTRLWVDVLRERVIRRESERKQSHRESLFRTLCDAIELGHKGVLFLALGDDDIAFLQAKGLTVRPHAYESHPFSVLVTW